MRNKLGIHFEGDENWDLSEINPDSFFHGWFKNKKGKFLEAGSGIGNYVVIFSKLGFQVTGVEIDKKRIALAKENLRKYKVKAKIIQGDIRDLDFKDNSFDYVFSHGVVEHFPETQTALKELNRVLKKKGEAMISVPNTYTFFTLTKLLQITIDKIFKTNLWKGGYETSFSISQFKKMLEKAGFHILEIRVMEAQEGKKFPWIGKLTRILDKPLFFLGIGGHFIHFFCKKE
jgi:ubiquinone/menaquinone biosynthesis C-methylase UbiE